LPLVLAGDIITMFWKNSFGYKKRGVQTATCAGFIQLTHTHTHMALVSSYFKPRSPMVEQHKKKIRPGRIGKVLIGSKSNLT
jgi:hypothetical protein